MDNFFKNFSWGADTSCDFKPKKHTRRKKISSLDTLDGFVRIGEDLLVNKAKKDLWKIEKDADGSLVIFRLFDAEGNPIEV